MPSEAPAPEALVHIIDDDEAMRESLGFLLDSAGFEARTYASALAFLGIAQELTSGCIVSDVRMPGMNGLEMTQKLKAMGVSLPIVMMTGHGDVPMAVESMKAGVADFLEKPFDDVALLRAIRSAMATVAKTRLPANTPSPFDSLSPRERDVLTGMIEGKANKVIAFDLGISPRTVEVYRANVMSKSNAGSLAELVRMAMTAGLA